MSTNTLPSTNEEPVLEAVHLRKEFPLHKIKLFGAPRVVHAVEDASLALRPGHATALVGESGSGKTTVARLLARLYTPTAGTIRYREEVVKGKSEAALRAYRRHVQMVFQDPFSSLNPVHTVRHHLSRPLHIYGHVHSEAEETRLITSLLERVNLTPSEQFMHKYPHQLSGGQRQRVAIARALAAKPSVLLADEPVSMLDVSIRLDVLNLLLRLKEEERLALLFITHDLASARYFAEDTLVMYAGQMVEGGPSEEVIQLPKHPYTQLLLSAAPDPDRFGSADRQEDQKDIPFQRKSINLRQQEETAPQDGEAQAPVAGAPFAMPSRGKTGNKAHFNTLSASGSGEPPSLISPPGGCRFHPRCPHAMPICSQQFPPRTELGGGHWVHCFLYGAENNKGHMDQNTKRSIDEYYR
ncbi:MAG TPA: oligopeptide/dipeptide ABC transporter ATP-binding protein [Ktedonobacteraceae bacterium]